jgi:Asp-tRNA(Asn)/Glu-tRNA(Gln) amidotransferase A subunit family amidase
MTDLLYQPATRMAALIRERKISPSELLEAHLRRIEQVNPKLNAIIHLDAERARREAAAAERMVMAGGETGPLLGVPLTIKSSIDVVGLRCECGSKLRAGTIPRRDATLVTRLRQAGAIILGVTNVPDMLVAYETDNLLYGRTNNPWDLSRTSGGSSGGESAAIASGCSAGGMGSDGGGSVRVPAHCCGIYGIKPTAGVIPRTGHWPPCYGPGSLMGLIGPMARSAADVELLLRVTAGQDFADPMSAPVPLRPPPAEQLAKLKIGWYEDDGAVPVTPETREAVRKAVRLLGEQGFATAPHRPTGMESARDHWWMFFGITGAALTRPMVEGHEKDVHPIVQDLLAPPDDAVQATFDELLNTWMMRDALRANLLAQMEEFSILVCPVGSVPAFGHGERSWTIEGQTVSYAKAFVYCQVFNLLGNPAAVVPVGRSPEGLPIGVQIVGRPFEDMLVLAVARKLEEALGPWQAPPEEVLSS